MGFIDYHGTKEDRYADVLEYAKAQQEEEIRQIEEERIGKWIGEFIGDTRFSNLSMTDLIKYVIVRYRQLLQKYSHIIEKRNDNLFASKQLWNNFCLWFVVNHIEQFPIENSKKIAYLQTFIDKVFKLQDASSAEEYYRNMSERRSYQKFFEDSFSFVGEKNFWKWIAANCDDSNEMKSFEDMYIQLCVLISYYFYLGLHPQSDKWIHNLETEKKILEQIKIDYKHRKPSIPDISALQPSVDKKISKPFKKFFDREKLNLLLSNRNLSDYVQACDLLHGYGLTSTLAEIFEKLIERISILENTLIKFKDNYQPDMDLFYDFYIPEALTLTANYIDYYETGIQEKTLSDIEKNVIDACNKLLLAVNSKIDEICRFAAININASAKALDNIMGQNGYVDPAYKLR